MTKIKMTKEDHNIGQQVIKIWIRNLEANRAKGTTKLKNFKI